MDSPLVVALGVDRRVFAIGANAVWMLKSFYKIILNLT